MIAGGGSGVRLRSLKGLCLAAPAILSPWSCGESGEQAEVKHMHGRFSFDNYLGMTLFALLAEGFWWLLIFDFFLAPRVVFCGCPVETKPVTGWGCCGQLQVPWLIQAYPILFLVLLAISLPVSIAGISLGRKRGTTVDANLVYALELCPFLMLVFLGVVACIVYTLSFRAW